MIFKKIKKNKGFVLLFAVTLAAIFLSIALGVSSIALKEINFGTSVKNTDDAFYAADTGEECALYYDRSGTFFNIGTNPPITCNNVAVTAIESPAKFWTFSISGLNNGGNGCVTVTVDKTNSSITNVIANGYNNGKIVSGSCQAVANSLQREIKTSY